GQRRRGSLGARRLLRGGDWLDDGEDVRAPLPELALILLRDAEDLADDAGRQRVAEAGDQLEAAVLATAAQTGFVEHLPAQLLDAGPERLHAGAGERLADQALERRVIRRVHEEQVVPDGAHRLSAVVIETAHVAAADEPSVVPAGARHVLVARQ